jgi:nicotinate phosphoribosyltransferase
MMRKRIKNIPRRQVRPLSKLYKTSLVLLTDLYQIKIAYVLFKLGLLDLEVVASLYIRKNPFGGPLAKETVESGDGGYTVHVGLSSVVDYIEHYLPDESDLRFLANMSEDGKRLFADKEFINFLREMRFRLKMWALRDGEVFFPNEDVIRLVCPLWLALLLESPLLYLNGYPSVVGTRASRMVQAANGRPVSEYGLRRSPQAEMASIAARIGGCASTSNVFAAKNFGIPWSGSGMSHAAVTALTAEFGSETQAFEEMGAVFEHGVYALVDTTSTQLGAKHAAEANIHLKAQQRGTLAGIRLDSGDLSMLSRESRIILNHFGQMGMKVAATNDLDELIIESLLVMQGAQIDGVAAGTKLVNVPSLGCVFKIGMVRRGQHGWKHVAKNSDTMAKAGYAGYLNWRRYLDRSGNFDFDLRYDQALMQGSLVDPTEICPEEPCYRYVHPDGLKDRSMFVANREDGWLTAIDPRENGWRRDISPSLTYEEPLIPIFSDDKLLYDECPSIDDSMHYCQRQISRLHESVRRFNNPNVYHVGLESRSYLLRRAMQDETRRRVEEEVRQLREDVGIIPAGSGPTTK